MTIQNEPQDGRSALTSPAAPQAPPPPSLPMLVKTTVLSLVVAGVLLVTIVLPAEYGVDPIGTGRLLGLTEISSPPVAPVEPASPNAAALAPVTQGPLGQYPAGFKLDVFEITLQPYEYIEYKYGLEQNATLLYSWTANAPLIHDFHGERTGESAGETAESAAQPQEESYDKENRQQAHGSFTAPFTGIHGWYWENPGSEPITLRLTSSGFYSSAVEVRSDRTRNQRDLRSLDSLSLPENPAGTTR